MKRNVKQEFQEAMDELHFSGQEKAAMTQKLLSKAKEAPKPFSRRKMVAVPLAAALILSTMTAAAVYTRWPKSVEDRYQFTEQEKQIAEKSGLSVLPQETKPSPTNETPQIVSATDQGITISVVQTMMDSYNLLLVFRFDGFDVPEGEYPSADFSEITIHGRDERRGGTGHIFNGIVERTPGIYTYVDGTPLQQDENGTILRPVAADGSFEMVVTFSWDTPQPLTTDITARWPGVGIQDGLDQITLVEGNWELSWTLTGSDQSRTVEPNLPIGDSGFTLRRAELTPLTAILEIEGDDNAHISPYTGEKVDHWIATLMGVNLKDGTYIPCSYDFIGSKREIENDVFLARTGLQVVDVEQIESLVFGSMDCKLVDGEYVEGDPYIVPIS